jgi:hypothetical protein
MLKRKNSCVYFGPKLKLCKYAVSVTNLTVVSISEVGMTTVNECSVHSIIYWKVSYTMQS